jgi:hypothetical protein
MKQNALKSLLALWTLAFSSPAGAFVCSMPCKMSQAQMRQCALRCSSESQGTRIGKTECMKFQVKAAPQFTSLEAAPALAPVFGVRVAETSQATLPALKISASSLRAPPGPTQAQLSENPSANAPPILI